MNVRGTESLIEYETRIHSEESETGCPFDLLVRLYGFHEKWIEQDGEVDIASGLISLMGDVDEACKGDSGMLLRGHLSSVILC
jgi:hypothetical protein